MKKLSSLNRSERKKYIVIASFASIISLAIGIAAIQGLFSDKGPQSIKDTTAKTTSDAPSAQADFSEGGPREPSPSPPRGEATINDNGGIQSSIPPESEWHTSAGGALTVYSPAANALLTSGQSVLSGKSTQTKVSFRLIDNVSGVIAQGELPVTSGTYSGTFKFNTSATQGRLDVFNTHMDGVEYNNIEIPVRFQ